MRLVLILIMMPFFLCAQEEQEPELDIKIFAQVGVRATPVDADGIFQINNIPLDLDAAGRLVGQQYRRVRFYAQIGDDLIKGNSHTFLLEDRDDNGDFAPTVVTSVDYSNFQDLPAKLTIDLTRTTIFTNESVTLAVNAHYADGRMVNLMTEVSGLSLYVSDPTVLTIRSDGSILMGPNANKVTSVAVMAYFDGLVASQNIKVVPSLDRDGDGMNDTWEQLYYLNYNDPNDRDLDADLDGLPNYQEYLIGSNPIIADTDSDGLMDGIDPEPLIPESVKPSVTIASPIAGSSLTRGEFVSVSGIATDNAGVNAVRVLLGGVSVGAATLDSETGVYQLNALVSSSIGDSVPLVVIATDIAGNTNSVAVSVRIVEEIDNKPPIVDAGEDVTIPMDEFETRYAFRASIADELLLSSGEGMPPPFQDILFGIPVPDSEEGNALFVEWASIGENEAFIDAPDAVSAVAFMNMEGEYEYQLTVSDGEFISSDVVKVTVTSEEPENIELLSLNDGQIISNGVQATGFSFNGDVAAFVCRESEVLAPELSGARFSFDTDVFIYDINSKSTQIVSVASDGVSYANGSSFKPMITNDGQFVTFLSRASNLVDGDTNNGKPFLYRRDLIANQTTRLFPSITNDLEGGVDTFTVTGDGRYVFFISSAVNVMTDIPGIDSGQYQLYRLDTLTQQLHLVSVNINGEASEDGVSYWDGCSVSDDGNLVVFSSQSLDLVAGVSQNYGLVYIRNISDGVTKLVSKSVTGESSSDTASQPYINRTGTHVVFQSSAIDLDVNDPDLGYGLDIFVYTVSNEEVRVVAKELDDSFYSPSQYKSSISDDGKLVVCNYEISYEHGERTRYISIENGSYDDIVQEDFSGHEGIRFLANSFETSFSSQYSHITPDTNYRTNVYYHKYAGLPAVDAGPDNEMDVQPDLEMGFDYVLQGSTAGSPVRWQKEFGPGVVEFSDDESPTSTARFYRTGTYVLKLSTLDGQESDEVVLRFTAGFGARVGGNK